MFERFFRPSSDEQMEKKIGELKGGKDATAPLEEKTEGPTPVRPGKTKIISVGEQMEFGVSREEIQKIVEPEKFEETPVEEAIANLPENVKKDISGGLAALGFGVEEWKNNFLSHNIEQAREKLLSEEEKEKTQAEQGKLSRFLIALKNGFEDDAKKARLQLEKIRKGEEDSQRLAGMGKLATNLIRYGRIVADVTGATATVPLRYVMLGSMAFQRTARAMQEARLMKAEVIEKTRIEDEDSAAEEAWRVHSEAERKKEEGEIVTEEDLEESYRREIPKSIADRLSRDCGPEVVSNIAQKVMKKQIGFSIGRIQKKIGAIETDNNLSREEKERGVDAVLKKYEGVLNDYDRILTRVGTVDALAMGARYARQTSQAVVMAMTVQSVYKGLAHLLSLDFFQTQGATGDESFPRSASGSQGASKIDGLEFQERAEELKKSIHGVRETLERNTQIEIAKKGDSIWKMAERKLEDYDGFNELTAEQKRHVINEVKNLMGEEKLKIGQEVDFSKAFVDGSSLDEMFEQAKAIKGKAVVEHVISRHGGGKIIDFPEEGKGRIPDQLHYDLDQEVLNNKTAKNFEEVFGKQSLAEYDEWRERMLQDLHEANERGALGEVLSHGRGALKEIGLSEKEYSAIKNVTVKEFLKKMPEDLKTAKKLRLAGFETAGKNFLPHSGPLYREKEFIKQFKLAQLFRALGNEKVSLPAKVGKVIESLKG